VSRRFSSLNRRLAAVEQEVAERVKRVELADCNCPKIKSPIPFLAFEPGQLEEELNRGCPVHGLRRFGRIRIMNFVNMDLTSSEDAVKCEQLIEAHQLRLAQQSQSSIESEQDDSQES